MTAIILGGTGYVALLLFFIGCMNVSGKCGESES